MTLDLLKDFIKINKTVYENTSHFNITNDIILPDFKPDLKNILDCSHKLFLKEIKHDENKVTVLGAINYNLIYYSKDLEINNLSYNSKFSQELVLPTTVENPTFNVNINIETSEQEILNERRVLLKHVASISLEESEELNIDIVSDVRYDENIELLKENIYFPNYIGRGKEKLFFKEDIEIESENHSIYQLLRNTSSIKKISYKIIDDKIIVSGIFENTLLYLTDSEPHNLETFRFERTISQVIDISDIDENSKCDCKIDISDISFEVSEDSDGQHRIISCETIFDISATAYCTKNLSIISDAYGFDRSIEVESENISTKEIFDQLSENFSFKNTLPLNNTPIGKIHDVTTKILSNECTLTDNDISINGILNINTFIETPSDTDKFKVFEQEFPFTHLIDYKELKNLKNFEVQVFVDNIDYNINSENNLDFKINLSSNITIYSQIDASLSTNISEHPLDDRTTLENRPSLIVYFAQPNDSLWKIAKKYLTTVDDLKNINGFTNSSEISAGQQILINKNQIKL